MSAMAIVVSWSAAAAARQALLVQLLDDGTSNAAGYGLVALRGPQGRLQGGSCPARSPGETPDGTIECAIDYDQPQFPTEWQAGDLITARVERALDASIPADLRPTPLQNACVVTFEGWSGPCTGKTGFDAATDSYVCEFVLPSAGGVTLGATFSGYVVLSGDPVCPALAAPVTTTTRPPGSSSTTTTTLPDPFFTAIDALAEGLLGRAVVQGLGRLGTDFTTTANTAAARGTVRGTATATGLAPAGARGAAVSELVIARGKGKVRRGTVRLKLKLTKRGRRFLEAATQAVLRIDVVGRAKGARFEATRTTPVLR